MPFSLGTDLLRLDGGWSNHLAARYQESYRIRDAKGLRINAYRVLLTRAGMVVYFLCLTQKYCMKRIIISRTVVLAS